MQETTITNQGGLLMSEQRTAGQNGWRTRMIQRITLWRIQLLMVVMRGLARVQEDAGQEAWVSQVMILGIILLIAAAVFAFWKAGGMTWVNSQLSSITTY
ncbi:MAG: hypothetical protein C7B46_16945 [Sulfobacillus benefaciens]|uniref:Uncharacterized protein n=1 Tax=Sulfobacillus benefaciens TaxID=453960 RepID=A0A2T2XA47_9FIRM|nr:MAG: hypothetical protein C7B46_16945 [Sulfobacillus benefaciens]